MATHQLSQKLKPGILHCAEATFDIAETGTLAAADIVKSGVFIPDGAVMTRAWYHVHTTFAGGGTDAATIKLGTTSSDANMVAALAIADGSNIWDAGVRGTLIGSPVLGTNAAAGDTAIEYAAVLAASAVHCTANEEIMITTATNTVTAGKMTVYVEYVLTGDLS
tara:strand:+ start:1908 stop:2402 length:495 start_codon:yes stop_codon:yes gene_type:complete